GKFNLMLATRANERHGDESQKNKLLMWSGLLCAFFHGKQALYFTPVALPTAAGGVGPAESGKRHRRSWPSSSPVSRKRPSGENATALTPCGHSRKASCRPVSTS